MQAGRLSVAGHSTPPLALARAETFLERLRGLLGHRSLGADEGLWITPCGSVHTFGMRFPIDVVFVGRDGRIVRIVDRLAAGRVAFARSTASVVELAAGAAVRLGLQAGQQLLWSRSDDGVPVPLSRAVTDRKDRR